MWFFSCTCHCCNAAQCQTSGTVQLIWRTKSKTYNNEGSWNLSTELPLNFIFKGSVERSLLPWAIFLILHETGHEVWRSPLHAVFYWNVKGKTRKKRKNTASFVASLGAGVHAAVIDPTTFHVCQRCRKTAVFAVFSRLWGVIWWGKAFRYLQCQFLI